MNSLKYDSTSKMYMMRAPLKCCESWRWSSTVPRFVGVKCLTHDWLAWSCLVMPTSPCRWHRVRNIFQSAFVSWLVGFTPVRSHGAASLLWLLLLLCLSVCPDRGGVCGYSPLHQAASACDDDEQWWLSKDYSNSCDGDGCWVLSSASGIKGIFVYM